MFKEVDVATLHEIAARRRVFLADDAEIARRGGAVDALADPSIGSGRAPREETISVLIGHGETPELARSRRRP
jgi:hypothetical protein